MILEGCSYCLHQRRGIAGLRGDIRVALRIIERRPDTQQAEQARARIVEAKSAIATSKGFIEGHDCAAYREPAAP